MHADCIAAAQQQLQAISVILTKVRKRRRRSADAPSHFERKSETAWTLQRNEAA
jgi:hypothetical protein